MKTKTFSLLFALTISAGTIFAVDNQVKIGDLYYNLNYQKKTAEVTYEHYDLGSGPRNYTALHVVDIPASVKYNAITYRVTSIGESAFNNCPSLTTVTIPNSVTSIGREAFYNCTSLTAISIPNSVTAIGVGAVCGCSSLTSIEIPNSVTTIEASAFYNCTSLTSIELPNSVTYIKANIFKGCTNLTSVTIGSSVTSIGHSAFYGCSSLTSIEIPNSVTTIEASAFGKCTGLTSIELPNSITSIGSFAFQYCSGLASVAIGSSITSIGSYAFNRCTSMASVTCIATTPPQLGTSVFGEVDCPRIPLYVYRASAKAYRNAYQWKDFAIKSIEGNYAIMFLDWDETELLVIDVMEDSIPVYTGATPTRSEDAGFVYTFSGWTPEIVAATSNATYTATYIAARKSYTITWLNDDGSLIDQTTVEYGAVPTHANPSKLATAEYTYTFAGWTPKVVAVTGNATYRATFKATKNRYTITWLNDDDSLIDKTQVEYGLVPTHADPVKANTFEFTYAFAGWTPDIVAVTSNATYTATYTAKHNYSVTVAATNGAIIGAGRFAEGTQITLEAIPNYGYHFVRWSDGDTDNPRRIVVTKNIDLIAEFAIDKSGACGANNLLKWSFEDKTSTLTISGNGELTQNYTFGIEAPTHMKTLVIGNDITSIGDSAFFGMTTINHLSIGSNIESIGDYAFAECKNFDDITCYANTVPTINATTFDNVGNKYYIYLFVPEERIRAYKRDTWWGQFDVQALSAKETETTTVTTTTTETSVDVTWPSVTGAATYELVIKDKDGNVICTLIFNSDGQLTSIAFSAPSRDGAPQRTQTTGFAFTVTGLEAGTEYDLTITAKNEAGQVLDKKNMSFHTNWPNGIEDIRIDSDKPVKVLIDGQIYILRGEHVYDTEGKMVR